ncbi:hypothetical protein GT354_38320 [Streptomyces sp. SID3343]|nr:hypothetical protein [Streptomyces sp. SID3343]
MSFDGTALILVRARERTRTVIPLAAVAGVDRPDDRRVRLVIGPSVGGGAPEYLIPVRRRSDGETFARALTASVSAASTGTGNARPTIREVPSTVDVTAAARRKLGRWIFGYLAVIALLFAVADGKDADGLLAGMFMGPMGVGVIGATWLSVGDTWKLLLRGIRVPGKVVGSETHLKYEHPVLAFTTRDGQSLRARGCHSGALTPRTLLDVRYDRCDPQRVSHKRGWISAVGSVIGIAGGLALGAVLVVSVALILLDLAGFR